MKNTFKGGITSKDKTSASTSKKRKSVVKGQKQGADKSKPTTKELPVPDMVTPKENRPVKKKAKVKPQGGRKVPEASDKNGCVHQGLLELLALPKAYLEVYVRVGGWLHKKPCKDCAVKEGDSAGRVLDVSTLLGLKGKNSLGYYCNCGPTGHKMVMDDEPVWKQQWSCDMVLCMPCYDERMKRMGEEGGRRNRRQKKRLD